MTREQIEALQAIVDASPEEVIQASVLVEHAKDPTHPWHDRFDWDDAHAAQQYRLSQARQIIRSVKSVIVRGELQPRSIVYTKDARAAATTPGYVAVQTLALDAQAANAALDMELNRIDGSIRRARRVADELKLRDRFEEALTVMVTQGD